jgi:hypothetical protein
MRALHSLCAILSGGALLAGCALPSPDYISRSPFTVQDLTTHIRCEIERSPHLQELSGKGYVVQITLSLKVDDNGGLSPNLSFLSSTTFAYALNGNLNLDRQQTYSTSYALDLQNLAAENRNPLGGCKDSGSPVAHNLSGNLDLEAIIEAGIAEIGQAEAYNAVVKLPGSFNDKGTKFPNFGSTVQFMLTEGFDTGPAWMLTNFKGPSGGKGILNGGRITTDNVIFAFAAGPQPDEKKIAKLTKDLEIVRAFAREAAALVTAARLTNKGVAPDTLLTNKSAADARVRAKELELEEATAPPSSNAAAAAQSFTTNIILQNLSGQLH